MSARIEELTRRRLELQARCDQQRSDLGSTFGTIERRLSIVDQGIAMVRRVASAPLLLGVIGVALLIGPRRLLRWAGRVFLVTAFRRRLGTRLGT